MNREPLLIRAVIVGFLQLLLTAVVLQGLLALTAEQTAAWSAVIAGGGTAVLVVWTRGKVTPVDDPLSADGTTLVAYTGKEL
jgi:hypothetical protein